MELQDMKAFRKKVAPTAMLERHVAFAYIDGISIVISNVDKWTDDMVTQTLEEQSRLVEGRSSVANITHFFGDVFGAHHRKMIVQWMEKNQLASAKRAAMVTDSAIMRAALTAYSWLSKTETKAFEPGKRDAMCEWVAEGTGVNPAEIRTALESCYKLIAK